MANFYRKSEIPEHLQSYFCPVEIGLEPVPDCLGWATGAPCGECYVCRMVQVFREVRRVLRDDGCVFLNLGDSYVANRSYQVPDSKYKDVGNSRGMRVESLGAEPVYRLRPDLTDEQIAYVMEELAKARRTSSATQEDRE